MSLNLINGFTGQFSIGHAGFMAVGGLRRRLLHGDRRRPAARDPRPAVRWPRTAPSLLLALSIGGAVAAIAGLLVGVPSLRLQGDYLAIVTLGFGEIIRVVIENIRCRGRRPRLPGDPELTNFFWIYALSPW